MTVRRVSVAWHLQFQDLQSFLSLSNSVSCGCTYTFYSVCVWVIFFGLSDSNKNIRILFPFPLPLQPVGIHSRIRFLSVFMLCLKTDGLVLFAYFFLPLSAPGRGKLFACFQLGQMWKLAAHSRPCSRSRGFCQPAWSSSPTFTHCFVPVPRLPAWDLCAI